MNLTEQEQYYYGLAEQAAQSAINEANLTNIDPKWLLAQFEHETGNFTNWGATEANNFGGLKQFKDQPAWFTGDATSSEGDPYQVFDSIEEYAEYFGRYICLYIEDGIAGATTLEEYITALKHGGYFGDTLENYINNCREIYDRCFPEE